MKTILVPSACLSEISRHIVRIIYIMEKYYTKMAE